MEGVVVMVYGVPIAVENMLTQSSVLETCTALTLLHTKSIGYPQAAHDCTRRLACNNPYTLKQASKPRIRSSTTPG